MIVLLINKQKGFRRGKTYEVVDSSSSSWTVLNHEKKPTRIPKLNCVLIIKEAGLPLSKWGVDTVQALKNVFEQGYEVDYLVSNIDNDFIWKTCESLEDFSLERVFRSLGKQTPRAITLANKKVLERISDLKNQIKILQRNLDAQPKKCD